MVFPVNEEIFQISAQKRTSSTPPSSWVSVAELTSIGLTVDNGVEEWIPMEQHGWTRRLVTAKSITMEGQGKRNVGDTGNDYLASLLMSNGEDNNGWVKLTIPDGTEIVIPVVYNVTAIYGSESTDVAALNVTFLSDGTPTVTEGA